MEILKGANRRHWYRSGDRFLCVPAKCGFTSFRLSMFPEIPRRGRIGSVFDELADGPYLPEECDGPMFMAVRDPVDRFRSLWQDLQRDSARNLAEIKYWPVDRLLGLIEHHPRANEHWMPQSAYWIEGVTCIPFDRFLEAVGLPYQWAHKSRKRDVELPVERIRRHYAADYRLLAMARQEADIRSIARSLPEAAV